jgi:hypothetical protein
MRFLPLAVTPLALALTVAGCNGNTGRGICGCDTNKEVCLSGRCFPIQQQPAPTVPEPTATAASCGAFQQVVGPAIPSPIPPSGGPCATTVQPSGTQATTQELGDPKVGTSVSFQVPAGTSSFTIVMQAVNVPTAQIALRAGSGATSKIDNTAVPRILTAPDGSTWYDDMLPLPADGSGQLVFFGSNSPGVGSLTVPNTTRSLQFVGTTGLPAGTWTMTVSDYAYECATEATLASQCGAAVATAADFAGYATGVYRVAVNLNPAARPAQGTLNLGLYLHACPGASYDTSGACTEPRPLTAAGAPTDPDAQRFLGTLASLLAGGGLCLGQVTWYDLPDWAQTKWKAGLDLDATSCDAQLGQLLSLSQPVAGGQMNLFLVPELLAKPAPGSTSKTVIVGIDGTIPGPGTFSGTVQSGAAVSAANLRFAPARCAGGLSLSCGADQTAYIAAHEAGHFLGLYHTTESTGDAFDPLDDTFQCQCRACLTGALASQCGTASAEVTGTTCAQSNTTCGGGGNLMFWLLDSVSQGKLSPQQSDLMRSSPLVR